MRRLSPPPLARAIGLDSLLLAAALWFYHLALLRWMEATGSGLGALDAHWLVPLHAQAKLEPSLWLLPALAVVSGLLLLSRAPFLDALPPPALLGAAFCAFLAVAGSVAMVDGSPEYRGRRYPALLLPYARTHLECYGDVPHVDRLGGPGPFLAKFALPRFSTTLSLHSQTHPPGGVLFLWLVSRLFGPGLWPAALATVGFTGLAVLPVYGLGRELFGERVARAGLLLFLLTPNVVMYAATSMDGPFAVLPMLTLFLFYRAQRAGAGASAGLGGALMGLSLALAAFMTYAVVFLSVFFATLLVLAAREAQWSRLRAMLGIHAAGVAAFFGFYAALQLATGYDPLAALRAALRHDEAMMGTGHETLGRYLNLSLANLAAYTFGAGLPLAACWTRQLARSLVAPRPRAPGDSFVLGFAGALLALAFSTLFTLEVERIWLFLAPFVVLPAARLLVEAETDPGRAGTLRWVAGLLAFQVLAAETTLRTPW